MIEIEIQERIWVEKRPPTVFAKNHMLASLSVTPICEVIIAFSFWRAIGKSQLYAAFYFRL